MAKLGFLGLGMMGYPMARNLLRAGHEVALWSNQGEKARKLADAEKGRCCATPKEVAENADCVFLCVGNTQMARAVILGPDGIGSGARAGTVVADASTISPSESRKIGMVLKKKGIEMLDAPCTGSTPGAESGNLTFMIGGDAAVFESVKPYFEPMGKRLFYCGGAGMGLQAKLTQNLILSNLMMAFNEGMVLAAKGTGCATAASAWPCSPTSRCASAARSSTGSAWGAIPSRLTGGKFPTPKRRSP